MIYNGRLPLNCMPTFLHIPEVGLYFPPQTTTILSRAAAAAQGDGGPDNMTENAMDMDESPHSASGGEIGTNSSPKKRRKVNHGR